MCSLPCFIVERCFATLYLKDYEKNQRRHISYLLVFLLIAIGAFGAFVLQNSEFLGWILILSLILILTSEDNTIYIVVGLIVPNFLAVTVSLDFKIQKTLGFFQLNLFLKIWNKRKYDECQNTEKGSYTLAKRFQVIENVKSLSVSALSLNKASPHSSRCCTPLSSTWAS